MTFGPPSFSPSCARLGDFLYPLPDDCAYFIHNISTFVCFFALEPVKVLLRCQFLIRILVVLPLRKHIIDQPDGQQVEVDDADTELYTAQQKERDALFSQSVPSLLRLKSL